MSDKIHETYIMRRMRGNFCRMRSCLTLLGAMAWTGLGCTQLDVKSNLGDMHFTALTEKDISSTGRASFYDAYLDLYLFHAVTELQNGRWTISQRLFDENAIAYIDSWSVHPTLIHAAHDTWDLKWYTSDGADGWGINPSVRLACSDPEDRSLADTTLFFNNGPDLSALSLSGFFIEVKKSDPALSAGPLYVMAGRAGAEGTLFLYRYDSRDSDARLWIIGQDPGTDVGLAYTEDNAAVGHAISSRDWNILRGGEWKLSSGHVVTGDAERNVYYYMRMHRSLQSIPDNQDFYVLRNFVPIPAVGFGTGGLHSPKESIAAALRSGYRFLDLAREYHNEHIVSDVLESFVDDDTFPVREDLFLLSKVWPTDLGFHPTAHALYQSLADLKSGYLDSFLLHWPACYHHVDWMRCGDIVDPGATWKDSWRAMEKAYAEGTVLSIGVSNFGLELLQEIWDFASVRPHIVQNFADPSNLDLPVREFCYENEILYIPYAMQRNFDRLSYDIKEKISNIAATHAKSEHEIIAKSFLQSHAAVIPRSDNHEHIKSNINNIFGWRLQDRDMLEIGWPAGPGDSLAAEL